jgi:biopolymer transport protein ExbB
LLVILLLVGWAAAGSAVAQQPTSEVAPVKINYFARYVVGGGWITWFILLPMSVAMVALVIAYGLTIRRAVLLPESVRERIAQACEQRQYRAVAEFVAHEPSMLAQVVRAGLAEAVQGQWAIQRAIDEATEQESTRLMRRVEWLNVIGNIAPMVGLFGTVTGMIQAFYQLVEISRAGGVTNAAQLADAISLALVTTFWGLAIAIPALAAVAIFRNRIDAAAADCWLAAQEVVGGIARSAARSAAKPAAASPA